MNGIFRAIAYAAWCLAFGLSVGLAIELHQYNVGIALGVAVLALILSAFGLIMARQCGQQKDRLAMTIGIALWAAGAVAFAITEFGFWYSSYKDRHAEYVQSKTAQTRQESLKDMAWEALRTGEARATSAELEARIKMARQNELWVSSAQCANATMPKSRTFCEGYFGLEAKLASAEKLEALEARLLSEKVDAKPTVVHNVFAAADLIAENSNMSEQEAATLVVVIIALVLMLSRDLLLIVANPFGSATAARTAAKSDPVSLAGSRLSPQPVAPPVAVRTPLEETRRKMAAMKSAEVITDASKNSPEPESKALALAIAENSSTPDPDGTGTPAAKPEEPTEEAATEGRKGVSLVWDNGAPPVAPRANKRAHKPEGKVESWLGATTTQVDDPNVKTSSADCWRSYLAYCDDAGKQPIGRKLFSRKLGVLLGRASGKGRKRDSRGSVFTGLMINPVMATARRRVA